jgi:hypothetical protein
MVNRRLKHAFASAAAAGAHSIRPAKPGLSSVNEFLSTRFEFSENSRCILIECAQKRELPLQFRLLGSVMRHPDKAAEDIGCAGTAHLIK